MWKATLLSLAVVLGTVQGIELPQEAVVTIDLMVDIHALQVPTEMD